MFATLVGTNTESETHIEIFNNLLEVAKRRGSVTGDVVFRLEPDQISLREWSLELRGPETKKDDFLLAVTAPKVPSMSPIPIRKTIGGPLFSVIVMKNYFGIWEEGKNFMEAKDLKRVRNEFTRFLNEICI